MEQKAIILLSGGQDSATSLLWALTKQKEGGFSEIVCVLFDYGQKHKKELKYAKKNCKNFHIPYEIVKVKGILTDSALIDHKSDINAPHKMNENLPASFVPGRNALFLTIAASRYAAKGFNNIVTGVCQTDYSGYPDCRRVFIESMETSLSLATDVDWHIHTPLMYLTKAETWKAAKELGDRLSIDGVVFIQKNTLTDYNGCEKLNLWGRGKLDNPASKLREAGYAEAKQKRWI